MAEINLEKIKNSLLNNDTSFAFFSIPRLISEVERLRDNDWQKKYLRLQADNADLENSINAMTKERDEWRDKYNVANYNYEVVSRVRDELMGKFEIK